MNTFNKKFALSAPLILVWMLSAGPAMAQAVEKAAAADNPAAQQFNNIMGVVLLAAGAAVILIALALLVRVNNLMYRHIMGLQDQIAGVQPAEKAAPQDDFWDRLRRKYWEDPVPLDREQDVLLHHDYDGIRELDNSLPPWWVNLFYITIVFAGVYMYYYHFGGSGPSSGKEYQEQVDEQKQKRAVALAAQANSVDEASVTVLTDAALVGQGELIFKANCAACHGQAGEGLVGPNLTDDNWIHGGGIKNVFKTIKYGVPEKGMIAWSSQLSPSDIQKVGSYILTLRGTNPPNPKAPQGEIWADSTAAAATPK